MNVLILLVVVASFLTSIRKAGVFSLPTMGVAGLFVYSLPAILNIQVAFRYTGSMKFFFAADPAAVALTLLVWVSVYVTLHFSLTLVGPIERANFPARDYARDADVAIAFAILGYAYLAWMDGIFFFLESRDDQLNDYLAVLWRWVMVFGLGYSILSRSLVRQAIFFAFIAVIMVRGDRTIPVIGGALFILLTMSRDSSNWKLSDLLNVRLISAVVLMFLVILLAKPFYLAVKAGDMGILFSVMTPERMAAQFLALEPFLQFNHLAVVTHMSTSITAKEFLVSVFGNFLIVPSAFGIETNLYNLVITDALPYVLTYGIAGNPWAHGYLVGGWPMVAILGCTYAVALTALHACLYRSDGKIRMLAAVLGTLVAVYAHRNGVDNLFSFVRQMLLVGLALGLASWFYGLTLRRPRRSASNGTTTTFSPSLR